MKKLLIIISVLLTNFAVSQTSNNVYNQTNLDYIQIVLQKGLNELNLDSVNLTVRMLNKKKQKSYGYTYGAYLISLDKNNFIMYLSYKFIIQNISHELIHLKQFNDGRLITKNNIVYFNGKKYKIDYGYGYDSTPWEMEASYLGKKLEKKINDTTNL